jgi:LPS export ABC transporter permease LptF/LPS export ABC transporter permease LptG
MVPEQRDARFHVLWWVRARHLAMFRILDRYIIRELLLPFLIALLVFTFLLLIQPLAEQGERLIAKGVSWQLVARVLLTLVPQALAVTIPIALLIGLLIAFGRFSADRESVALQACGISIFRMLRPVAFVATAAWAVTSYVMFVAVPSANQTFREIVYGVVSARAENDIKPRIFFEDFPNRVLYVRDTPPGASGWLDVFLADTTTPDQPTIFTAKRGRMVVDRGKRTVDLVLEDGARHNTNLRDPAKYEVTRFGEFIIGLDPNAVFPPTEILKGDNEMSVAELQARADELRRAGLSPHGPIMALHRKFAIPVVCFTFALIGLGLGLTSGRDGKLASFVPGIAVVFVYYVIDYLGRQMAKGQIVPPWLATWAPNIVLGVAAVALLLWRARSAERPLRFSLPIRRRRLQPAAASGGAVMAPSRRVVVVVRIPQLRLPVPRPKLLDWYVSSLFAKVLTLAFMGLLGIFYISTFIDLSDKLFKGSTTGAMLLQYLYFATPQFVFYIVPLSVLITAMVVIGIITKNSELVVMKACGISLYRVAAPLLVYAILASALMFILQEQVLAYANRRAESIRHVIRGGSPRTFDVVNRKWLVARDGDIYNYLFYDTREHELNGLSIFQFRDRGPVLATRTYVTQARSDPKRGPNVWSGTSGWIREFQRTGETRSFAVFPGRTLHLEAPDYFATESPDADRMTYVQLRRYIADLRASGFNVVPQTVALHRKISFPFVTLIMTLIAVPFAVTTGRRGALYGIGVGIVLAVVYWMTINAFGAIGSAGMLAPVLAAWAPNLIFGAGAAYLLLTVRT